MNVELMDLVTYSEEAIGKDNIQVIDEEIIKRREDG
jgi:hypothetical protein